MPDITITIDVADWRDVPVGDTEDRAKILRDISVEAAWAAKRRAEDKHDIVLKLEYGV